MNQRRLIVRPSFRPRRGFTLLEVLVSLGIIIGALAGIAALLPAAGSRLAEATDIDRAATMAANARADLANRGLITAALWTGAAPAIPQQAVVFGEGLPAVATISSATATIANAVPGVVSGRIDVANGFFLRDAVQTTDTGTTVVTGGGFDRGICYGCMVSTPSAPSGPGPPARVTTAVFRKPGPEVKEFPLTRQGESAAFQLRGSGAAVAADRAKFLAGCSWLLAVGAGEPRWVPIASSWTTYAPGQTSGAGTGNSFVSLAGTDYVPLLVSGTLNVIGFDGLLQVDERSVNLE